MSLDVKMLYTKSLVTVYAFYCFVYKRCYFSKMYLFLSLYLYFLDVSRITMGKFRSQTLMPLPLAAATEMITSQTKKYIVKLNIVFMFSLFEGEKPHAMVKEVSNE